MIPPLQEIRLRSIARWVRDSSLPAAPPPSEALESRVQALDEAMMQTFEDQEDSLKLRLMKQKVWGTEAGLQQFNLDRMELWQEVVADYLPPISDPDLED